MKRMLIICMMLVTICHSQTKKSPQKKSTSTKTSFTIQMISVKGGTFTMGINNRFEINGPLHDVTLKSFTIGKYEVTQAQWNTIMGSNQSKVQGENLPVDNISWEDAQEFISKLNKETGKKYRLPTEAEWEFAAAGGIKSQHYKFSGSDNVDEVSWYYTNTGYTPQEVGTKKPNELGVYDMSGNEYEFCSDYYEDKYYSRSPKNNPTGPATGTYRVIRGGGYSSHEGFGTVKDRYRKEPDKREYGQGLRLVQ